MLKGLGEIGQLMKLQKEMKNMQNKLARATMEGTDPKGIAKATVNGEFMVTSLVLDDSFKDTEKGKLEKALQQAVNDAVSRIKDYTAQEMGKLKESIHLPGMDQFLK